MLVFLLDHSRHIHLQITAVARRLFPHKNTYMYFAGGRGRLGGLTSLFKHFLECTYFLRLVTVIIRILQLFFYVFSFIRIFLNLLNFYPVTRFLVTPLLVTRYCVTLFSNTRRRYRSKFQKFTTKINKALKDL